MGRTLAHRGPDDFGTFHDCTSGINLAFCRLSILDLSTAGHQPMFSASGRYVVVFNGEIYNFQEVRAELGGSHWEGHSDTEVLLGAIERWGLESSVRRFVGMFAFALWDRKDAKLSLVRDRLGIKPLYYGSVGNDFVFASELKAVCQHPEFDGRIDRAALALYMRHNYVPTPHCIYEGLRKLEPGHILTLHSAGCSAGRMSPKDLRVRSPCHAFSECPHLDLEATRAEPCYLNGATSFLILPRPRPPWISGKPLAIPGKPWLRAPSLVWSARARSGGPLCRDGRQRHGERVLQVREIPQLSGVSPLAYVSPRNQLTAVQDVRAMLNVAELRRASPLRLAVHK